MLKLQFQQIDNKMEELFELRTYIEQRDYEKALALVGEMEEMSRDDKINKVLSFTIILLLHLIKQQAEKRTTRSWDALIHNSLRGIFYSNRRRKTGGFYLTETEIKDTIEEAWETALTKASFEAFEGKYDVSGLLQMINPEQIKADAL